jgi:hypothetical protein
MNKGQTKDVANLPKYACFKYQNLCNFISFNTGYIAKLCLKVIMANVEVSTRRKKFPIFAIVSFCVVKKPCVA